ncbi:MAG: hypothetical protein P0S94_02395, partial [Simkaniaceae bacterium]|nr:hypothetical protein [Simkaniaceae bacterium]
MACSKLVDDIENAALTTPDAIRRAYRKRLTLKFISPDTALTSLPVNRKGEIEALFFSILENELVDYKSIEKALSLTDMIESGLLLMILGMIRQDESILLEALDKALLVIELLDRKGCPFSGLFCRPETFSHAAVYGMGYLLFATAASITEWPKYHLVAESMLTHFKDLPEAC